MSVFSFSLRYLLFLPRFIYIYTKQWKIISKTGAYIYFVMHKRVYDYILYYTIYKTTWNLWRYISIYGIYMIPTISCAGKDIEKFKKKNTHCIMYILFKMCRRESHLHSSTNSSRVLLLYQSFMSLPFYN